MPGILHLVSTPIGNYDDITFRALRVLRTADVIVMEELKQGRRLLSHHGIEARQIELLNEHNDEEATQTVFDLLQDGKNVALISDAGTPVFSDPGCRLVGQCIAAEIPVVPIPGASSLVAALVVSGFGLDSFLYYGWLSPKRGKRVQELRRLRSERRPIVLMDTPYRLVPVLHDIADVFGASRRLAVAMNLTMPDEEILRGTVSEVHAIAAKRSLKAEFVIIIDGLGKKTGKSGINSPVDAQTET